MIQQSTLSIAMKYQGKDLSFETGQVGLLRDSSSLMGNGEALRERMELEGYLYLPGVLRKDWVLEARASILTALEADGFLDPDAPMMEAVAAAGVKLAFSGKLATGNPVVDRLLYSGAMMAFWECFFGEPVAHFDYTWLRAKAPGEVTVTEPHCDTVYMNRGTDQLYTCWTPLGDVKLDQGGLMILSQSHTREDVMGDYWNMDVDEYCTNGPEADEIQKGERLWQSDKTNGFFHPDAIEVQKQMGGIWLTTEYQPGDMLVFGMHTLHAAADNQTNTIRLSTDSRYQPASEPRDERWIGQNPIGHGVGSKRGLIC